MQTLTYTGSGHRIDSWLTSQFPYSRNFFQHIIERRGVTVISAKSDAKLAIGLKVKKSYKLQDGDIVHIEDLERFLDGGILDECPIIEIRTKNKEQREVNGVYLHIMREEEDYMVIYKPKGVLSHPNSVWDVSKPSVVGGLYHYFNKLSVIPDSEQRERDPESPGYSMAGDPETIRSTSSVQASGGRPKESLPTSGNFMRAGLIHRLDKDTDGLMLIAKTEQGLAHFKELFQQKSAASTIAEKEQVPLKKYYRAVSEVTDQGKVFLDSIQVPHIIQEEVIPKTPHPVVKEGITKILAYRHCEEGTEGSTWQSPDVPSDLSTSSRGQSSSGVGPIEVDIEILTGRTHQIRYHLSKYGLPIVGDYLYGTETDVPMQLTAWKLVFVDIGGEMQTISLDS